MSVYTPLQYSSTVDIANRMAQIMRETLNILICTPNSSSSVYTNVFSMNNNWRIHTGQHSVSSFTFFFIFMLSHIWNNICLVISTIYLHHLSIYLLGFCLSSSVNSLFIFSPTFLSHHLLFLTNFRRFYIFWVSSAYWL